jgi:hypothetical protein
MKKLFILLFLFPLGLSAQETKIRYYSYSEFFEMVENEPDSVFELKNAIIKFDKEVDQAHTYLIGSTESNIKFTREDSITINKEIRLENVVFNSWRIFEDGSFQSIGLYKIQFLKPVTIINSSFGMVDRCTFKERVRITFDENFSDFEREVQVLENGLSSTDINNSLFLKGVFYFAMEADLGNFQWGIISCEVVCSPNDPFGSRFDTENQFNFWITNTKFRGSGEEVFVSVSSTQTFDFDKNSFENSNLRIWLADEGKINHLNFSENRFDSRVRISLGQMNEDNTIDWSQFSSGLLDDRTFLFWFAYLSYELDTLANFKPDPEFNSPKNLEYYLNTARIENSKVYRGEMKLLGKLYALYQQQHDTEYANRTYIEMKDLETSRLAYLYRVNPSFETFFTWKVNQFLKLFSNYGTKPSKAIVFSLYVILAFALVYLLFPNSWDAHGKNRIVDRYRFFFKYLNRNAGIHEVYLEEKQQDLLGYEEFKSIITNSEKSVPRFFSVTALPLYQWAVSGTQISAKILSKVDILKGTWEDLPAGQKAWKSFLLVGGFLFALVYDLLIKVLNALMLSINTFTTLGFGEIPIKGLPRYLAIIQGFIGWFMLTIFSVSLISQLLN